MTHRPPVAALFTPGIIAPARHPGILGTGPDVGSHGGLLAGAEDQSGCTSYGRIWYGLEAESSSRNTAGMGAAEVLLEEGVFGTRPRRQRESKCLRAGANFPLPMESLGSASGTGSPMQ